MNVGKIGVVSLGCAKNLTDTETMLGYLTQSGFEFTNLEHQADVLIVNTCGFIDKAKEESIDTILELARHKKSGKCKGLLVTGCLAQRYKDELLLEMPEIDGIIGTNEYHQITEAVTKILKGSKYRGTYNTDYLTIGDHPSVRLTPNHYAYLKIAEGCDNHCSYCVIPQIRGGYKSHPMNLIIAKAKQLVAEGAKEINVIAQDTSRYGFDIDGELHLPELIRKLAEIPSLEWIRILYCYPTKITEDLIRVIAEEPKVCNYLDIPLQHCNDRILKEMNRPITKKEILEIIYNLRQKIPNFTLRTSFILGFPGETNGEFNELLDFIKEVEFDKAGFFAYSREEETLAAEMEGQIDDKIKERRIKEAMELQKSISLKLNKDKLNDIVTVLVEGKSNNNDEYWGRTQGDAPEVDGRIFFKGNNIKTGDLIRVKVTDYNEYDLVGELDEDEFSK